MWSYSNTQGFSHAHIHALCVINNAELIDIDDWDMLRNDRCIRNDRVFELRTLLTQIIQQNRQLRYNNGMIMDIRLQKKKTYL